jgi:hypothetical protein
VGKGDRGRGRANLSRRLTSLEEIADELRLRPFRELAEEHRIPFEELMECFEQAKAETARLRAQGLSEDDIVRLQAERLGMDPADLRREADELLRRFG